MAVHQGHADMVRRFAELGFNMCIRHPDVLHLATAKTGHSLLHIAAAAGHEDVTRFLLGNGVDIATAEAGSRTQPSCTWQ